MSLPPLPVDAILPAAADAVRRSGTAVVLAPPGAGKTTRLPPALLALSQGRILVVQPRRVAARAAARRIAEERGATVGAEIGYQVRHERGASAATRLLVVTEGILLNLLQADPFLEGVGAIVFDEFHERNLASDLALAMATKVRREVRPDLVLVAMSATLDPGPVAAFLGDAPVLESAGRQFPVELAYLPRPDDRPLPQQVSGAVRRLLGETRGDLLVFLPGVGEILAAQEALAGTARERDLELVPLYGELAAEDQDRALQPGGQRRVVLATNVAETSLTLPGITGVVDAGLARQASFDPASGLDRLVLTRISQASAAQRAGRAGRLEPGVCLRLWTAAEQVSLAERTLPEIRRVDLAGAALQLLAWGEHDPAAFPWFEAPEAGRLEQALELLGRLGALERQGLSALGKRMARLPVQPRLARLLLEGERLGCAHEAAFAAALLSERSPFARADAAAVATTDSDLADQVAALAAFAAGRSARAEASAALRAGGARRLLRVRDQLLAGLGQRPAPAAAPDRAALQRCLLAAFPDRLARRREPALARAVMVGGRGVKLAPGSGVTQAELFLCLEVDAGGRSERAEALVRSASAVDESWLPPEAVRTETVARWDEARGRAAATLRRTVWDLVLSEKEVPASPEAAAAALAEAASREPARSLPLDDDAFASRLARLAFLRREMPELALPELPAALLALLPGLAVGKRSLGELRRLPWAEILVGLLTGPQRAALEREAPERLELPSGRRARLDYPAEGPPVLASRIQDFFGLEQTPRLAAGRVPVLLHLLAPNGRPQQVTQDLASFWRTTYAEVRRELAGRYPKHRWPVDPRRGAEVERER